MFIFNIKLILLAIFITGTLSQYSSDDEGFDQQDVSYKNEDPQYKDNDLSQKRTNGYGNNGQTPYEPQQMNDPVTPQQKIQGSMPEQIPQQKMYSQMPQQKMYDQMPQQQQRMYGSIPQQKKYGSMPQQRMYGSMPHQQQPQQQQQQQKSYGPMPQQKMSSGQYFDNSFDYEQKEMKPMTRNDYVNGAGFGNRQSTNAGYNKMKMDNDRYNANQNMGGFVDNQDYGNSDADQDQQQRSGYSQMKSNGDYDSQSMSGNGQMKIMQMRYMKKAMRNGNMNGNGMNGYGNSQAAPRFGNRQYKNGGGSNMMMKMGFRRKINMQNGSGYRQGQMKEMLPMYKDTQQNNNDDGFDNQYTQKMSQGNDMTQMKTQDNYGDSQQMYGNGQMKSMEMGFSKKSPMEDNYGQSKGGYGDSQRGNYAEEMQGGHPYKFEYNIDDMTGNTLYQKEEGDESGTKKGSYGYMDAYGVYRTVEYIADEHGFRATIKTNEPGTDNKNPADVEITAEKPPEMTNPGSMKRSSMYAMKNGGQRDYGKQQKAMPAQQQQQGFGSPANKLRQSSNQYSNY